MEHCLQKQRTNENSAQVNSTQNYAQNHTTVIIAEKVRMVEIELMISSSETLTLFVRESVRDHRMPKTTQITKKPTKRVCRTVPRGSFPHSTGAETGRLR